MARRYYNHKKYLKDKKITIVKQVEGTDESGFPIDEEITIEGGENIWAYYRQASGDEFYAAASQNFKVEVIFRINWRNDLENRMKILFKGKKYGITRIDDFEGYKQDLTIYAYRTE